MIGWYVHHVGSGHATRATAIAAHLVDAGQTVVGLSTAPRPADWPGEWVELPPDTEGLDLSQGHDGLPAALDVQAGGALHFAPLSAGFATRQQVLAGWVAEHRPEVMVVDVSVEVVALVRLLGTPAVTVAMPGDRSDAPHRLGYALAQRIVACWPPGAHPDHVVTTQPELAARTRCVGSISRFGGRAQATTATGADPAPTRDPALGVLLWGHGSDAPDARQRQALAAADPSLTWTLAHDLPADAVWDLLRRAAVVVTHGGQGAVADVAAAGAPAVLLPQDRPHDEQHATGRALSRLDVAVVPEHPTWPTAEQWSMLLDRARERGGSAWSTWRGDGIAQGIDGAHRAALAILQVSTPSTHAPEAP